VAGKVNSSIVKPTAASKGDASNDLNGATSEPLDPTRAA
jgi:hypothetical protein